MHYHLVFTVKYRKKLLDEDEVAVLREVSEQIAERYAVDIERLGCDVDQVHLLSEAHPKYAPGQLVRLFKSITFRNSIITPLAPPRYAVTIRTSAAQPARHRYAIWVGLSSAEEICPTLRPSPASGNGFWKWI